MIALAPDRPVWDQVVGQPTAVRTLAEAVADAAGLLAGESAGAGRRGRMTNFWLVTGPPGSGRSVIARAFAAGLQCPDRGCGSCESCREVLAGTHPDVELFAPEKLQITVDEIAGLLHRSSMTPMMGRWNVLVIEDADRLNEHAANALLKSLEEPGARTVWMLCVPTVEDLLPTIASRSRHVRLTTPTNAQVADSLVQRDGVDPALASFAARAAQGHIGRAAALARHEDVRLRRAEVLRIPSSLTDLPACFVAAANLLEAATADAASLSDPIDRREAELLSRAGGTVSGPMAARVRRGAAAALKELEAKQKSRRTRMVRDQVDRALLDLTGLFRDVLVLQTEARVELINAEMRPALEALAAHGSVPRTLASIDALAEARLAISVSVAPLLALEALMVKLAGAGRR